MELQQWAVVLASSGGAFRSGDRFNRGSEFFGISRCRWAVDQHAEVGPAVDSEGRQFEADRTENRMANMLDGFVKGTDFVVAPHRLELRAQQRKFVHQGTHFSHGARTRRIRTERGHHGTRNAIPVVLRGTGERVEKDMAQHVALLRR